MSRACALAVMTFLCLGPLRAQQPSAEKSGALDQADQKFLDYAAEDNQAEIQLCLVAEKRATNPALKAFARLMVDDHAEIESRLSALGNELQARLPDGIGEDGQKTSSELKPLYGQDFERAFMEAQIKDHSNDVDKFSKEKASTQNQRIRQFASETIPILQQHLALARAVNAQIGNQTIGNAGKN
jgi:putative membrane protein